MADSEGRFLSRLETKIHVIILLTTLAASLVVFTLTRSIFHDVLLTGFYTRARTVNQYAQTVIKPESFSLLKQREDADLPAYSEQQRILNGIRDIAHVRYLFTAARRSGGEVVYVIDGLSLGSEDFRFINDPVESEILPQVNACLDGMKIDSGHILDTSWGSILLTCMPLRDGSSNVVGAVVMEFDATAVALHTRNATWYCIALTLVIAALFILLARIVLRKVSEPFYKRLAYMDYLTGLNNRMAFELDLQKLEETMQPGVMLSIIVYDLNDLKMVNDTQGHSAGDAYLRRMAHLITGLFPDIRQNYRLGGDEFASLVREADSETLRALLQEYFENSLSLHPENYFVFSFGIATYDPAQDTDLHDVFNRADRNMYVFKAQSKQRFRTEMPPEPSVKYQDDGNVRSSTM